MAACSLQRVTMQCHGVFVLGWGWGGHTGDNDQEGEETKAPDYKGGEQWVKGEVKVTVKAQGVGVI